MKSEIDIIRVISREQIKTLAALAETIWQQHFTAIIGADQVSYMLDKFQSHEAIVEQISRDWMYFAAMREADMIAYTALIPDTRASAMKLSKLYVAFKYRQLGIGLQLLRFIEQKTIEANFNKLWLTVNRDNHNSITWYQRQGFVIVDEQKNDIGSGFYMDDFIMEKHLIIGSESSNT